MGRADHIYVNRGIYTHHGIDAGDGTVIHFSGEPKDKRDADIKRSTLEEFLSGGTLRVRRYGFRDDADVTMARAESRLGDRRYHLVTNNCEHFAVWCCTGKHASGQVRGAGSVTAQGAVVGTAAGATTGVVAGIGAVAGVSGPGIMTALSAAGGVVGGGAAVGPAVLAAPGAAASIIITQVALRDDETLPDDERAARRAGLKESVAGASAGAVGGVAAISAAGAVSGLSAAGIASGLAAIGGTVGGGMAVGTVVVVAAPAVLAAGAATGIFMLSRRLRKPVQARLSSSGESRDTDPSRPGPGADE